MSVGLDFFAGFDPRMSGVFLEEVKESFFSFFSPEKSTGESFFPLR